MSLMIFFAVKFLEWNVKDQSGSLSSEQKLNDISHTKIVLRNPRLIDHAASHLKLHDRWSQLLIKLQTFCTIIPVNQLIFISNVIASYLNWTFAPESWWHKETWCSFNQKHCHVWCVTLISTFVYFGVKKSILLPDDDFNEWTLSLKEKCQLR